MRKHRGTPSWRDKNVTPAAISPPGVARGRFVGGQQSGLAGCKPPPLFTRGTPSCSSQGRRQGETMGRLSTTECTYLPTYLRRTPPSDHFVTQLCWTPSSDPFVDPFVRPLRWTPLSHTFVGPLLRTPSLDPFVGPLP